MHLRYPHELFALSFVLTGGVLLYPCLPSLLVCDLCARSRSPFASNTAPPSVPELLNSSLFAISVMLESYIS